MQVAGPAYADRARRVGRRLPRPRRARAEVRRHGHRGPDGRRGGRARRRRTRATVTVTEPRHRCRRGGRPACDASADRPPAAIARCRPARLDRASTRRRGGRRGLTSRRLRRRSDGLDVQSRRDARLRLCRLSVRQPTRSELVVGRRRPVALDRRQRLALRRRVRRESSAHRVPTSCATATRAGGCTRRRRDAARARRGSGTRPTTAPPGGRRAPRSRGAPRCGVARSRHRPDGRPTTAQANTSRRRARRTSTAQLGHASRRRCARRRRGHGAIVDGTARRAHGRRVGPS